MWIYALACAELPVPPATVPPATSPSSTSEELAPGEYEYTFDGRTWLLAVPSAYDGAPLPLVVDLHGTGADAETQRLLSGLGEVGDAVGFLVAWPERPEERPVSAWLLGCDSDDVAYIDAWLDHLAGVVAYDPDRVVATGVSNGGYFANVLGAALPERFAALAPVASGPGLVASACPPSAPETVTIVHGTDDPVVLLSEGEASRDLWLAANDCGPTSVDADGCDAAACADGTAVRFCAAEGAGHVDIYAAYPTAERVADLLRSE